MTRVVVKKSALTGVTLISAEGHSGYAQEGSDIVCAAVSSANELVINILESFSADISLDIDAEKAYFCCKVLQTENNSKKKDELQRIAKGYVKFIGDLAEAYPDYLKISTEV